MSVPSTDEPSASSSSRPRERPAPSFLDVLRAPHYDLSLELLEEPVVPTIPLDTLADMSRLKKPKKSLANGGHASESSSTILEEIIYKPTGEWEWLNNVVIRDATPNLYLSMGSAFSVSINTGIAGDRNIHYLSKLSTTNGYWDGFHTEVALYKTRLMPLQGVVVPTVIGVYCDVGRLSIAMAPPHRSFFMSATPDMPKILKQRCVEAVQKLHTLGVYHGDMRLSNILIGGDAKVTIMNFQSSRVLDPETFGLASPKPSDFEEEMKLLKQQLHLRNIAHKPDDNASSSLHSGDNGEHDGSIDRIADILTIKPQSRKGGQNSARHPDAPASSEFSARENIPKRFVMPGQTSRDLVLEVGRFLDIIECSEDGEASSTILSDPPSATDNESGIASIASIASVPNPVNERHIVAGGEKDVVGDGKFKKADSTSHRYNLRKRKQVAEPDYCIRPVKKIRFHSTEESSISNSTYDSEGAIAGPSSVRFPPIKVQDFAYELSPSASKEAIVEANIRRCAELGLPHPDALKRDPMNPRWQDPAIIEYVRQHNNQVVRVGLLKQRHPDRPYKVPRARRSEGSLKRAMQAISERLDARNKQGNIQQMVKKRKLESDDSIRETMTGDVVETWKRAKFVTAEVNSRPKPGLAMPRNVFEQKAGVSRTPGHSNRRPLGQSSSQLPPDLSSRVLPYIRDAENQNSSGENVATTAIRLDERAGEQVTGFWVPIYTPPYADMVTRWIDSLFRLFR